jgi:AcrR family transcriptional regulator
LLLPLVTSYAIDVTAVNMTLRKSRRAPVQPYHHGDLKSALRDAARVVIARNGAGAFSLREVARMAGVSHAASYRHYPNKEALLADLAERGFRDLAECTRAAAARYPDDPLMQLRAAGAAYVDFGVANPDLLQLMFGGFVAHTDDHPALRSAGRTAFAVLSDIIVAGQQARVIRSGDRRDFALSAWALVHGLALLVVGGQVSAPTNVSARQLAHRCAGLLVEGLAEPRTDTAPTTKHSTRKAKSSRLK